MKNYTISVIPSPPGFVGVVTDFTGEELYRTARYHTAHGAFNVAFMLMEKRKDNE